jgi:hypothetical protein
MSNICYQVFAQKVCFNYTGDVESTHLTYIGIDVQAAQKPFYYTALDADLEMIACGHGRLADVLAYLAGQSSALVAVNGPVWAPHSEVIFSQGGLFDGDQSTVSGSHRRVDVEMTAHDFPEVSVLPAGKKTPIWMERSLGLIGEMKKLGYQLAGGSPVDRAYFETNTDAAYHLVTGTSPYDSRSLEGRLQRQLLLYEFGFPLKDPMSFLEEFTRYRLRTSNLPLTQISVAHELRALMAAAISWLMDNRPETIDHPGKSSEPPIILPKEFSRK